MHPAKPVTVAIRVFQVRLSDPKPNGQPLRFSMLVPVATTKDEALASARSRFGADRVLSVT